MDGYFSILHHSKKSGVDITVHHFDDPTKEYCKTSFDNFKTTSLGDPNFWKFVPKYYIGGFPLNDRSDFHLMRIQDAIIHLEDDKLEWYEKGSFDFMYQGLTGVSEYNNELIFTVQRDGSLYRYDLDQNKITERVMLAGNYGNPQPSFLHDEIWVADYDTIIRFKNWKTQSSKKLQKAAKNTAQFIGSFSFNSQRNLCIVPRPFSGDVLGLTMDLKVKFKCSIGGQPLEAALMNDNTVIARDWQTGKLLQGKMKRKWF